MEIQKNVIKKKKLIPCFGFFLIIFPNFLSDHAQKSDSYQMPYLSHFSTEFDNLTVKIRDISSNIFLDSLLFVYKKVLIVKSKLKNN